MTGRDVTPEAPAALEILGIAKRFGATVALAGVDFAVRAGEVHALVGENGAGKSTLMNVVVGAVRPDRGAMRLAGDPYAPGSPLEARRRGVALIHQELSLCPHLTVAENILLGAEPARAGGTLVDRRAMHARAAELLEHFNHPEIRPERRVAELPLAARQVVEICRALAAGPSSGSGQAARVLLMDEPTSAFQREDIGRLFALIRRLTARGIAVVYISHFLEEVREIADRYTVLRDGRSVDAGTIGGVSMDHLVTQMVGRPMTEEGEGGLFPERAPDDAGAPGAPGEVVLEVRGLAGPAARRAGSGVLRSASFTLRRGEILGVAGLMGAGRTELVRTLFGLDPAAAGTVTLRGRALALRGRGATPRRRLAQGFGYLSEDRKGEGLALPLSIADNLCATGLREVTRGAGVLDLRRQRAVTRRWIDSLRIRAGSPLQRVRSLSGGNQQKVAIGRLLHQDADVLLLDEPTRGIDIGSKAQVYEVIARCAAEGKAVLLVSSHLPELFGLCDRLAVMSRGVLSPVRPTAEWTPETVLAAALGSHENSSMGVRDDDRSA